MSQPAQHHNRTQLRVAIILPLVGLLALVAPAATAKPPAHPELTVMSRNIYLGSSLQPALGATTPEGFVLAVAQIYGTMVFTDFPTRAGAIADEIAATEPDLIGLQEVSNWVVTPVANPTANARSYEFLDINST